MTRSTTPELPPTQDGHQEAQHNDERHDQPGHGEPPGPWGNVSPARMAAKTTSVVLAHAEKNGKRDASNASSDVGSVALFDWADLETRFERTLAEMDQKEANLLVEFDGLVKFFKVWASAASAHDNERATKRLRTRTHFVRMQEDSLAEKQQHYVQVMGAFQSAMALLNRT